MPTCDNAGRTAGGLGVTGCWDNDATVTLQILYDEYGADTDSVDVCQYCAELVEKDARKHGYTVQRRG